MSRSHPLATQTGYSYQVSTVQQSVRDRNLWSWVSLPKKRQHPLEEAARLDAESRRSVAARFPRPALPFQRSCQNRRHSKILVWQRWWMRDRWLACRLVRCYSCRETSGVEAVAGMQVASHKAVVSHLRISQILSWFNSICEFDVVRNFAEIFSHFLYCGKWWSNLRSNFRAPLYKGLNPIEALITEPTEHMQSKNRTPAGSHAGLWLSALYEYLWISRTLAPVYIQQELKVSVHQQ